MPITTEIDISRQLTVYTVTGKASRQDFLLEMEAFYQGNPTRNVLWDLTAASLYNITAKDAETLSSFTPRVERRNSKRKTAFVTAEEHIHKLARYFKAYGEMDLVPIEVKIFTKLRDAYEWLLIDE